MRGSADSLRFVEPASAKSQSCADEAVEENDLDSDRNGQADETLDIRGGPATASESKKDESNGDNEIALDYGDHEVNGDDDVRDYDQQRGERHCQ